jgi:broad specificity phosphatase PhoE
MPNVTRLYLIRHGQSAGNAEGRFGGHGNTPLSELGIAQARATARVIADEKIDVIYSSDLLRALQTAEHFAGDSGIQIISTAAFRERDVGVLEGLTFEESRELYPRDYYALVNREIDHVITGGESYRQLLNRITRELRRILRDHSGSRIAIVSHTGVICFLTLYLLGAIHRKTQRTPWIITSNCGISRFELRGRRNLRVITVNDVRHLQHVTGNDSFAVR